MPKAIVIHAGFHKTGTSTVQAILRDNRAILKPVLALRLKPQMKHLLHATRGFSTWRDPVTLLKAETRFATLLDSLPGMPRRILCLSAEELSGHMPGRGDLSDYSAAPELMDAFCRIASTLFPSAPVHIVYYRRDPQTWMRSAWAEHVKSSSMTLDFTEFAHNYPQAADFDPILDSVAHTVPAKVHVFALEDFSATPAKPLLDVCRVTQDIQAKMSALPPRNTRLPDDVLLELLAANRAYPDRDARRAAKQTILEQVRP